jgi:hypothetical protein
MRARQRDPVGEDMIVRERFKQMVVDLPNVLAVIGQ